MISLFLLGLKNLSLAEQRMALDEARELWDVDVLTAFSECTSFAAAYPHPLRNEIEYTTLDLGPDETACVFGSIIMGGTDSYHVKAAYIKTDDNELLPKWNYIDKDNVMAVIPDIKVNINFKPSGYIEIVKDIMKLVAVAAPPVTTIKCNGGKACKVQIHPVPPSYDLSAQLNAWIDIDVGFKFDSYVSTRPIGNFDIKHYRELEISTKGLVGKMHISQGIVLSPEVLQYNFTREKKCDFLAHTDVAAKNVIGYKYHSKQSGVFARTKNNWFITWFNIKEVLIDFFSNPFALIGNPIKQIEEKLLEIDCGSKISWQPAPAAAAVEVDPEYVYFDKFTYKLPTKGGVYTREEIKKYNRKLGIILGTVGAVALVIIGSIIAVVVVIHMKKKKNSSESSSSSNKNNKV